MQNIIIVKLFIYSFIEIGAKLYRLLYGIGSKPNIT